MLHQIPTVEDSPNGLQISLAQWSLHRTFLGPQGDKYWDWFNKMIYESPDSLLKGEVDPFEFPTLASELGVNSIELVNVFYLSKTDDFEYWKKFKNKCNDLGITVGLIMCDHLGDLADSDAIAQSEAIEAHYKWVDVAKFLGAHSIRVNAYGEGSKEEVAKNAVLGLSKLGHYGTIKGINVIVENHNGYSSHASWLSNVISDVDMLNVGTLPDFGNFCIVHDDNGCIEEYDKYKGMRELMPFAKGVSAKTYQFDSLGYEINIDYIKMIKIVREAGYKGYIGIEYEGSQLTEKEGILATKRLLEKIIQSSFTN